MRGCLAPTVLEMAFLRSERQAKAVWQPGAGNRRHPPRSHPQCSLLLITHSLCRPLIPASSILASPVSLRADARQPAEPQQLSCRAPGCPPISAEPGGCASPLAQQRGPTLPPPTSAATGLLVGGQEASAGSLQLLLFLLLLDDTIFVSPVLSQLHQHPNCAQLPFMAGMCRQVQVSQTSVFLLENLSIGKGGKWLKNHSQALMAVTMQDYLPPIF